MINVYNNASSKNSGVVYASAAAAERIISTFEVDEYTTYKAKVRADGKAVIVVCDEDGYELGCI